jgi:putative ABC transport system permease protein
LEDFLQDLRHALRVLRRSPGFALAAILTLGLGIGANTTMFAFMDALLLRPFALPDLDRLVTIWEWHPQEGSDHWTPTGGNRNRLATGDFLELRSADGPLASVAAYSDHEYIVTGGGEPERILGYLATPGYFETLGIHAAVGRTFVAEDGVAGRDAVAVLGHGFWQRRFASDPSVVGRTLRLDGRQTTIVGVLPVSANFPPGRPEIFGPLVLSDTAATERRNLSILGVGRLKPGVDLVGAQSGLDTFASRLAAQYPDTNAGRRIVLLPLTETEGAVTAPFLFMFEGAAAFVLLIACANVAGLLIGRAVGRRREMAVRGALGASRGRIVRQLLTEGLVLSLGGAALALYLAKMALEFVRASAPADFARWVPGWLEIGLDGRSFLFTLGVAVAATLAFGLLEAVRSARVDLVASLKTGGRSTAGPRRRRLRNVLVATQIALALVLLAGAGLMTRGFLALADLYQGFDTARVVTMRLDLPERLYPDDRKTADFYDRVLGGLATTPGIEAAGVVTQVPADLGPIPRRSFDIEGRPTQRPQDRPTADFQVVSPGYLPALGIMVRRGRNLSDGDGATAPRVALVSESLARRYWPGEDPIGRRVLIGDGPSHTIVGVVSDVKQYWFDREDRPTLYVSYLQAPRSRLHLVVRSPLATAAVVAAARAQVQAVDAEQPIDEIRTMATVVSESAAFIGLAATLMTALGGVALLLAMVGLYSVMADTVAQRTHEIGVRMALGARVPDVIGLIVGEASRLTAVAVACGLFGAWALGRLMSSALYGIVRPDLASLIGVTIALVAVALTAAWIPARRAARVDPLVALREE